MKRHRSDAAHRLLLRDIHRGFACDGRGSPARTREDNDMMRISRSTAALLWALASAIVPRLADAQTPPTPAAQPVPLAVNGQLTPWLQTRGELRTRVEGFTGGGFGDTRDAYWMDRFRLNATIRPAKSLAFVTQVQDSRAFDKTAGSQAAPFRNTLDFRMAYVEIGGSPFLVRAGRQELAFGEQRLVGGLNWTNTARSFDGVRSSLKGKRGQIDGFAASVVSISPADFDKSGGGNLISGAYASLTALPKQTVEPYVFWRQARDVAAELGGTGALHQVTTGIRMAGTLPAAFDYSGEMAVQTGSVGPDDVMAWAGHGAVGRTFGLPVRLFGEYNYASGDASGTDGTRRTFDQLYPTGHDKLGLSDQVGWRNIHNLRVGLEGRPTAKWLVAGSYHSWWLASPYDALYSASGAAVARSATGTAGRYVGQEIDGQLSYVYSPQLQIGGGYAQLIPGEFLNHTTPGHSYKAPYVMVTYVFLGEKPSLGRRKPQ
jgi:hypothetical protein